LNETRIVLAGNPNVGKSTIFNNLTGMHQHTGNWAGKTVVNAKGVWKTEDGLITLIDAPGCYSLNVGSKEEEVARDMICDPECKGVIVVCDGTRLERNLILLLQILTHRKDVVLCINLMDQVEKAGITIDVELLSQLLGVRVITTRASQKKESRKKLEEAARELQDNSNVFKSYGFVPELLGDPYATAQKAENIAAQVIKQSDRKEDLSTKIDRVLTNPFVGFPVMALMFLAIFWTSIKGANYPSEILGNILFAVENPLWNGLFALGLPIGICDMVAHGMYKVLAWVVSVMLPPMAIFFPLFTLLEDWGFLPRVAFNLDRCFRCCDACGKQALTMCMGLGCNASAVVGCRIIDSKRERLMAMVTNSLMPCNGRFPILISIITIYFAGESSALGAFCLTAVIFLGIAGTLGLTKVLSVTLLKGIPSSFTLELPPYRKPDFLKVIVRSLLDRTIFVLGRAVAVAAPCGVLIWLLANITIGNNSVISYMSDFFDPLGKTIGLDGVLIVSFILGIPANEIVLPIAMMIYMSQGTLSEITDLTFFGQLLEANGWTMLTAINMMVFTLMHWPCATTLLSIKKESGSWFWSFIAFVGPTIMGMAVCGLISILWRFFL